MKTETEIIAGFMGFTPYGNGLWWNVPKGEDLKYKAFKLHRDKLIYNTSWDWLMPVVEKIESIRERDDHVTIARNSVFFNGGMNVSSVDKESKIIAVYDFVVKWIKWYNSQPTQ